MTAKLTKRLTSAITLAEVAMLLALVVLEWHSGYRAGLMHHLYYKKRYYLATLYHESRLIAHLPPVAASILAVLFFCRSSWRAIGWTPLVRYGIALLALPLCYFLPGMRQLNVFAHLVLVLECCLLLETLRIFLSWRRLQHEPGTLVPSDQTRGT